MLVGDRFTILKESDPNKFPDLLPIILGPGRAFGSGEHETTRSCLEQLENINLTEKSRVLDIGCGSGILAIAASRMGAKKVVAFDPDHNAVSTARANIILNGLESSILLFQGELSALKDKNYSLIMANLYGDILLNLIKDIGKILASGAILILSGILYEYSYDIKKNVLAQNCEFSKAFYLDEYTTMIFRKHSDF